MQRLSFLIEGSRGDEYEVVFERNGSSMSAICTCPAGESGLYCKHRFALMDGDISSLLSDNADEVERLRNLLIGTTLQATYRSMLEAEREHESAKRKLNAAKKALARVMSTRE